jgi:hypothetical protein
MLFAKTTLAAAALALALGTAARAGAEEIYELKKSETKALVGAKGTASLTIAAKSGWHINDNEGAPLSLKLVPEAGITVDKPLLKRTDVAQQTKEQARFDVAFTASEAGHKTINGDATFVMCQAATCKMVHEKVALAVDVSAPAAAKPGKPGKKK